MNSHRVNRGLEGWGVCPNCLGLLLRPEPDGEICYTTAGVYRVWVSPCLSCWYFGRRVEWLEKKGDGK